MEVNCFQILLINATFYLYLICNVLIKNENPNNIYILYAAPAVKELMIRKLSSFRNTFISQPEANLKNC